MYTGLLHTHKLTVVLFLLIYVIKTVLILFSSQETLDNFRKKTKVPEMIISTLFLLTGIGMLTQIAEIKHMMLIKIAIVLASIPIGVIAYKRHNKALAILTLLLIVGAYGLAEMSSKVEKQELAEEIVVNPADQNYDEATHGKEIYSLYCVLCHGEKGDAQKSGAKSLITSEKTREEILGLLKEGKNSMPPYKGILSEEDMNAVASYAESLRQ